MAQKHIDLSQEMEGQVSKKYQDITEEVDDILSKLHEELEGICSSTGYLPFVNSVNSAIEHLNGEGAKVSHDVFQVWKEGDASFRAAASNSEAGESAEDIGAEFDNKIEEIFNEFWSNNSFHESIQVDTSRPTVQDEDFDHMKDTYIKYAEQFRELQDNTVSDIEAGGDDNPTFTLLSPAVIALIAPIKKAVEGFAAKIDDFKEKSNEKKNQQSSKRDEASNQSATSSDVGAQDIASALSMFEV